MQLVNSLESELAELRRKEDYRSKAREKAEESEFRMNKTFSKFRHFSLLAECLGPKDKISLLALNKEIRDKAAQSVYSHLCGQFLDLSGQVRALEANLRASEKKGVELELKS